MGCLSSKQKVENDNSIKNIKEHQTKTSRRKSANSKDSGIELSYQSNNAESTSITGRPISTSKSKKKTKSRSKGIAFEVAIPSKGIINQHPPKKLFNDNTTRGNSFPSLKGRRPPSRLQRAPTREITSEDIQKKLEEAKRRRESERLAVIAHQRRRELRAKKVLERKKQYHQLMDHSVEDDISDVDSTFNVEEDNDWDRTSTGIEKVEKPSAIPTSSSPSNCSF